MNLVRIVLQTAGACLGAFLAVTMLPDWLKE